MTYPRGDGRSPISSTSRGCRAGPASPGSSSTGKERSATFLASDSDRADRPSIPLSPSAGGGGTFDQAVREIEAILATEDEDLEAMADDIRRLAEELP
jgi:hypothetical protein